MGILRPIVITALSILIISWAVPSVSYGNWTVLVAASIVITLLQKIGRPILHLLLLPINIVTLGLFSGVINVILMWLATALVPGFHIQPITILGHELNYFLTLLFTSFLISFAQSIVAFLF